jgi:O-glycosyl hydrolase
MKVYRTVLICVCLLLAAACQAAATEETAVPIPSATQPAAQPTDTPESPTQTPTAQPSTTSTPLPALIELSIDSSVTYQTMDGFGANSYAFPYANDMGWNWEAVKFIFDELDIAYIRLAPWLGWWETANDNDDPYVINWDGFGTVYDIINWHDVPYAQFLSQRGIELSVGVWDFGGVGEWCDTCEDWLASGSPRTIPPELYPEMGESIAAYILNMQKNGVTIAFAEVQNEPDIQAAIQYPNPEALRDAALVFLEMLDHHGVEGMRLHGPNLHSPRSNLPWIDAWLAEEDLRARTAAVSYHTWWSEDFNNYDAIWQAASAYGLPVWATEAGYAGNATAIDPTNWLTAYGFAEAYYRAIAWSHASRVYHWALLGFDGVVSKQGERFPMFYAFKHFSNYIPPDAVLIESSTPDPFIQTLAFVLPEGGYSVIILNGNRAPRRLVLADMPVASMQAVVSSLDLYDQPSLPDETGALLLPPLSVTSILLRP